MLEFLNANKISLIEIGLSIFAIILVIAKKKVKIDSIFEMVLAVLPQYIRDAEKSFEVGTEKYSYVFNKCLDLLELLTAQNKQRVIESYATKINAAIENILSTPQKKER